jgi:gluconolactonase
MLGSVTQASFELALSIHRLHQQPWPPLRRAALRLVARLASIRLASIQLANVRMASAAPLTATMLVCLLSTWVCSQETAREAARTILDPQTSDEQRAAIMAQWRPQAAHVVRAMIEDLPHDLSQDLSENEAEEYRRIPHVWKLAIDAVRDPITRTNQVRELTQCATPANDAPLRDWQAVVLGGAVINGLSLNGEWPALALQESLSKQPEERKRFERAIELAKTMATNPRVRTGTRYDAIRMLALRPTAEAVSLVATFLKPGIDDELQMGAVSALSDIDHPDAMAPLLQAIPDLSKGNRELAMQAMQRTPERQRTFQSWEQADSTLHFATPFTQSGEFTSGIEGPAADREGNVFAVNFQSQQTIGHITPNGRGSVLVRLPNTSTGNGIVLDRLGNLWIADYVEHRIYRYDRKTQKLDAMCHEPNMNQPNDLAIAADGTLYASDPDWSHGTGQIWRIDRNGIASRVATDMGTTNGLDLSPDGKWLYVNESVQRHVWRFPVHGDGSLGDKELVHRFREYGMDGMRCAANGNLFITRHGKGTVVIMKPSGDIVREIDVLGSMPSNLCFGGPDGRTVFVTEVEQKRIVRFRTDVPGRSHTLWPAPVETP